MGNYSHTEYSKTHRGLIALISIPLLFAVTPPASTAPQDSDAKLLRASGSTRHCTPTIAATKPAKSTAKLANSPADPSEGGMVACLEIQATPIEIQEFIQSLASEHGRTPAQLHTHGDTSTFVRHLEKDELLQYAKTEILAGHITWTEGKAFLEVKVGETADDFTRVQITARFQGHGQTSLALARPTDWWPLASKGTLEGGMIAALESHFSSGH